MDHFYDTFSLTGPLLIHSNCWKERLDMLHIFPFVDRIESVSTHYIRTTHSLIHWKDLTQNSHSLIYFYLFYHIMILFPLKLKNEMFYCCYCLADPFLIIQNASMCFKHSRLVLHRKYQIKFGTTWGYVNELSVWGELFKLFNQLTLSYRQLVKR